MCYGSDTTAGGNDEQKSRQRKRWTCRLGGKMEYLVLLVIILVLITNMLNDNDNK
jgi:hypothetical protein